MAFVTCEQLNKALTEQDEKIKLASMKAMKAADGTVTLTSPDGSNITIDPVRQGDKGDRGERGATGAKGEDGRQGVDGKSAYQIWRDAGNTGTEADFLTSLKGQRGEQGVAGTNANLADKVDNVTTFINTEGKLQAIGTTFLYGDVTNLDTLTFGNIPLPNNTSSTEKLVNQERYQTAFDNAYGMVHVQANSPHDEVEQRAIQGLPTDFVKEPNKFYKYDVLVEKIKANLAPSLRFKNVKLIIREVRSTNPDHIKTVGIWERKNVTLTAAGTLRWSEWKRLDNVEVATLPTNPTVNVGAGLKKVSDTISFADFTQRNFMNDDTVLALGADGKWVRVKLPKTVKADVPQWVAIQTDVLTINGAAANLGATISKTGQKRVRFSITNNYETAITDATIRIIADQPSGAVLAVQNQVENISNGVTIRTVTGASSGTFFIPSLPVGITEFDALVDISTPVGNRQRFAMVVVSHTRGRTPVDKENHELTTTNLGVTKEVVA